MSIVGQLQQHSKIASCVVTILPSKRICEACVLMRDNSIGSLVVVDSNRQLVGMITERDIICKVVSMGLDVSQTQVCEAMTTEVLTCTAQTTIQQAKDMMAQHCVRHLPIMDGQNVVGMVSSRDILLKQLSDTRAVIHQQLNILHDLERSHPGITSLKKDEMGRVVIQCN